MDLCVADDDPKRVALTEPALHTQCHTVKLVIAYTVAAGGDANRLSRCNGDSTVVDSDCIAYAELVQ